MKITIGGWSRGITPEALDEIAVLWNRNAPGRHGFFPWTGEQLSHAFSAKNLFAASRLVEARADGALVGFSHVTWMREYGYPPGGAIEAILVDQAFRRKGIGMALLRSSLSILSAAAPGLALVDALGAWPYGFLYTTLADGSERSGVFSRDSGLQHLFRQAGFQDERKSLVMRAKTDQGAGIVPIDMVVDVRKRNGATWLDLVFRNRELWDHNLYDVDGAPLSRAVYGFMPNESKQEKQIIYSIFGVNTPAHCRGRGLAGINIRHLLSHLKRLGADFAELHVYADNDPAVALYRKCGFEVVADTMMMLKDL